MQPIIGIVLTTIDFTSRKRPQYAGDFLIILRMSRGFIAGNKKPTMAVTQAKQLPLTDSVGDLQVAGQSML